MSTTDLVAVPTTEPVGHVEGSLALEDLRRSVRDLGDRLAELSLTDPRWQVLGDPVSAVAELVRRSVGRHGATASGGLAPIVRLRELGVAGRALLGRDATIVDPGAARDARAGCARIVMALA